LPSRPLFDRSGQPGNSAQPVDLETTDDLELPFALRNHMPVREGFVRRGLGTGDGFVARSRSPVAGRRPSPPDGQRTADESRHPPPLQLPEGLDDLRRVRSRGVLARQQCRDVFRDGPAADRRARRPRRDWPGRPGWSPTQAPHRSGRADFQHPVPHPTTSLRGPAQHRWTIRAAGRL
jgi:hypothetical protein